MHELTKAQQRVCAVFVVLVVLVFVVSGISAIRQTVNARSVRSDTENRYLEKYTPISSFQDLLDGSWGSSLESFLKDHTKGRSFITTLFFRFQTLSGRTERNGYVLGKNHTTLQKSSSYTGSARSVKRIASVVQKLKTYTDSYGGTVVYMDIPHKNEMLADNYPLFYELNKASFTEDRQKLIALLQEDDISVAECYEVLSSHMDEYIYFRGDNHYTQLGAYYAYQELLKVISEKWGTELSFPDWNDMEHHVVQNKFYGTYVGKIGYDGNQALMDQVVWALPEDMPEYHFEVAGKKQTSILDTSEYSYDIYMGGNIANTVVATDRPELPSVLFIGYSYTNALETMGVYNFDRMESIDPRYYEGDIGEYILQSQPDFVVVVRSDIANKTENISLLDGKPLIQYQ